MIPYSCWTFETKKQKEKIKSKEKEIEEIEDELLEYCLKISGFHKANNILINDVDF